MNINNDIFVRIKMKKHKYSIRLGMAGILAAILVYLLTPTTYEFRIYFDISPKDYPIIQEKLHRDLFQSNGLSAYVDPYFNVNKTRNTDDFKIFDLQLYYTSNQNIDYVAHHYLYNMGVPTNTSVTLIKYSRVNTSKISHPAIAVFLLFLLIGLVVDLRITRSKG